MNAPPGVDSASSSGEDEISPPYSPVSPDNKPHFSLKSLFLPESKLDKSADKDAKPEMGDQFVGSGIARAPSPIQLRAPKKKVRIHVSGQEHPDSPKDESGADTPLDLVGSPISPMSIGDAGSPWGGATSPISSPAGNGPPANEVFDLLRQLLVDRTQSREAGGDSGARLELVNSSDSDSPREPLPPVPPKQVKQVKKKPSRIMAKLSKLTSPRKTSHAPSEQDGSDTSSSFSATDGYSPAKPPPPSSSYKPARPPTPAFRMPPHRPSPSQPNARGPQARRREHYIDPSSRMPDGRKAHGLAEEDYHPERAGREQHTYGGGGRVRQSRLPYLSRMPSPVDESSRRPRSPRSQPWLHFPSPWQPPQQLSSQPPHSAPLLPQQQSPSQQQHPSGEAYYGSVHQQPPYSAQLSNPSSPPQASYQQHGGQQQGMYQYSPQPPQYAYSDVLPSQAPYSPPWTAPAPEPTYPQWHSGYHSPYHWPQAPPAHPPPFPHPHALQPWQPYYPPTGYPDGPQYPSSQPMAPAQANHGQLQDAPSSGHHDPEPQSPLDSLPNPHSPMPPEKRKSSAPAVRADGLDLHPANEAKSPVKTRLHGLPGSINVKVEDAVDEGDDTARQAGDVKAKESGAASASEYGSTPQDQLRMVNGQREELKKRLVEGKIDKEKGKQELDRRTKLQAQLHASSTKGKPSSSHGKTTAALEPEAGSTRSSAEDKQSTAGSNSSSRTGQKDKLKIVTRQREELKKRIAEGKIDRGKGKNELDRLTRLRDQLQAANENPMPSKSTGGPSAPIVSSSTKESAAVPSVKSSAETPDAGAALTIDQLKTQISDTEKQMVKVKSKMLDNSLDREKGEGMLVKLDKNRKQLRETLHEAEQGKTKKVSGSGGTASSKVEIAGSGKSEVKGNRSGEQEAQLAQLESRTKRIKQKVKEGTLSKEDAEKEMRKLMKAREAVLIAGGAEESRSKPPVTDGQNGRSIQAEDSLDPEILKQVLSELPAQPTPSRKPRLSVDTAVEAPRSTKGKAKATDKDQADTGVRSECSRRRPEQAQEGDPSAEKASKLASARPSSMHIPGSWHDGSLYSPLSSLPRVDGSSSAEVTWSKCLVSLAHCIDLGQELSTRLLNKHKNHELHDQDGGSFLVVEFVPRLLTSLFLQRDIVHSMRGILGEQHSQAMGAFLEHMLIVKKFLEIQHAKQKEQTSKQRHGEQILAGAGDLHGGLISAFESGSLHAILEHVLGFSDFLTPHLLKTLRSFIEEWKEQGLSISSVIHIIMTLRKELNSASEAKTKRLKEDKAKVEPSGTLDLLDKLLSFIDGDRQKRKSIQNEPPEPRQPGPGRNGQHSSSRRDNESPDGAQHKGIKDKVARVLHIDRVKDDEPEDPTEKRDRERSSESRKPRQPEESKAHRSAGNARVEDASDNSSTPSVKSIHREPHGEKDVKLPSLTEEFLHPAKKASSRSPNGPNNRVPSRSKHDHHSTVVRPPGPSPDAKVSHHHAVVDPEQYPDIHKNLSRGYSTQSKYSQDSAGTLESDEEAKALLAKADSGPQPVEEPEEESLEDLLPSDNQVRMAREVLQGTKG